MATRETVYTGVRLPADIKRRVRILAAELGISTAVLSARLIGDGLAVFEAAALDPESAEAKELAAAGEGAPTR